MGNQYAKKVHDQDEVDYPIKVCMACGVKLEPRRTISGKVDHRFADKKFCSTRCSSVRLHASYAKANERLGLSTGKTGAVAELLVCAELLRLGWEVFRAVSPACSCDMIAIKGTKRIRVEVRTGWMTSAGRLGCPRSTKDDGRSDVFAIVHFGTNKIEYRPSLESL